MIIATEWMDQIGQERLRMLHYESLYAPDLWQHQDALGAMLRKATALVIRNRTAITSDLLDQAPHLRVIGRLGVGLDNIDLAACHARGIHVVYARSANAIAVVEYVMGALLYSVRPWLRWSDDTKAGNWQRSLGGRELYGKSLGIVGLGDIGSRIARMARFLGMRVQCYDPHVAPFHPLIVDGTVQASLTLEALLATVDVLSLHAPLRSDTYHLLNKTTIPLMKSGMVVINTARGALIDENALREALMAHVLKAVFLDVREIEPPLQPDPLAAFPEVYLTPHIAGLTQEAMERTTHLVLDDVMRELHGQPPRSPVR